MRRKLLIASLVIAVLLLAGLGVSISLVRGTRRRLRSLAARPTIDLALERSASR